MPFCGLLMSSIEIAIGGSRGKLYNTPCIARPGLKIGANESWARGLHGAMRWCYKTAHKLLILSSKIHIQKIISFCSSVAKLPVCWVVVVAPAVRIGMVLSCVVQSKVRDSATDLAADFGDVEVHFGLTMPNPLFTLSCGDLRAVIQM